MSRASNLQTNFTAGELSPRLGARVDVSKYNNGCFLLQNFMVIPQGGVTRRPGTKYVAATKYSNKATRLLPFKFSTSQNYILEMGDLYFRFFKDNGQIITSGVLAWVTATVYAVGALVTNGGNTYYCITAHTSGATFAGDASKWYQLTGSLYEIPSVYTEAQLSKVRWAQSTDTLYLVHKSVKPKKLTRTGHTSWTIVDMDFKDGPYLDTNAGTTTLTPSATTGSVTVTASAITDINGGRGFLATDVGRCLRLKNGSTWGWGKITAYTSTTVVTVLVTSAFAGVGANATWALGAWSDTTGWPGSVAFYEDRLWFGGTTDYPQTLTASMSGAYETFSPTQTDNSVVADNGLSYTISTDDVNEIKWMSAGKILSVFTSAAEFTVSASNLNEAITPTNVKIVRETNRGCSDVRPVRVDSAVLFWQKAGRKLREYAYSFNTDAFAAPDMTVLGEHISKSGIKDMDYQQEPYSMLWTVRLDGLLLSMTYNREQEVTGWARHILGGTDPVVSSVASIPSVSATFDEVWLIVSRTINGATVQYVEYISEEVIPADEDDKDNFFFMDCGATYSGAPTTTISGLTWLVGETVTILGDGAVQPSKVVNGSGQITLDRSASVVQVGLGYKSALKTVRWEVGGNEGTSQAKPGRIHKLGIRFLDSLGCKFGRDELHLEELNFRNASMPMNSSPPLFSGDKVVAFSADYGYDRQVYLETEQPYPVTVLGIMPSAVVYG